MSDERVCPGCKRAEPDIESVASSGWGDEFVECPDCDPSGDSLRARLAEANREDGARARKEHEARIRAEAAAERTREIVERLRELARDREGSVLASEAECEDDHSTWQWLRGQAKAARSVAETIEREYPEAFPKPGSGNRDHAPGCATFGVAYNRCDCKPRSGDGR